MNLDQDLQTILDLMPAEDARTFKEFLKYQPIIKTMIDSGVFNVRNGQVVMNFNDLGKLMQVNIQISAYNHGKMNTFSGLNP